MQKEVVGLTRTSEQAKRVAIVPPPSEFEGSAFKVVPHAGSKQLAVFMTQTGAKPGFFNFLDLGDELPVNRIYLNNGGRNEWYQGGVPGLGSDLAETLDTLSQWGRYFGVEETVVIGHDMGAHGAILFGTQLGARVLAFSPETTLKLPASRSEKLMAADAPVHHQNLHEFIRNAQQPVTVVCGERDPADLYCMSLATSLPNYHGRTLRRVAHGIPAHLQSRKQLLPMLQAFLAGEPLPPLPTDGNALEQPGFATYFYALHVAHARKEWSAAIRIGREVTKDNSWSDHAYYLLGDALARAGEHDEALRAFAMADALLPNQVLYRCALANGFKQIGDYDQAIAVHRKSMQTFPKAAAPLNELGVIYAELGLFKQALSMTSKAAKLDPKNRTLIALVKTLKAKVLGKEEPYEPSEQAARLRTLYGPA